MDNLEIKTEVNQFKIQNYRSIKDTGWLPMSVDKVTALVGQNESGKSSILDALSMAFGVKAEIDTDDFRMDEALPSMAIAQSLDSEDIQRLVETQLETYQSVLNSFLKENQKRIVVVTRIVESAGKYVRKIDLDEPQKADLLNRISKKVPSASTNETNDESVDTGDGLFKYEEFRSELWRSVPEFLLFKEEKCPLPNRIDLQDGKLADTYGQLGAQNFIDAASLKIEEITSADDRKRGALLGKANSEITSLLQEFWSQLLGKATKISIGCELQHYKAADGDLSGQPYLRFWVKEGDQPMYPSQRSRGTRWFIAFFLQLIAEQKRFPESTVILLDEPATYLHPSAQLDVVRLIEKLADKTQVMYSTHSPYMLDQKLLHRILAVERVPEKKGSKETVTRVRRGLDLAAASQFTLAPILALMGVDLSHQQVIKKSGNVILEEPSAFYYFEAFRRVLNVANEMHFIAASGADNVKILVDLFVGWGLGFIVLVDDDVKGKVVTRQIRDKYSFDEAAAKKILHRIHGFTGVEDLFSRSDFETHVVEKSLSAGLRNSEYVDREKLSKPMLAVSVFNKVTVGTLSANDFDEETLNNFRAVFKAVSSQQT